MTVEYSKQLCLKVANRLEYPVNIHESADSIRKYTEMMSSMSGFSDDTFGFFRGGGVRGHDSWIEEGQAVLSEGGDFQELNEPLLFWFGKSISDLCGMNWLDAFVTQFPECTDVLHGVALSEEVFENVTVWRTIGERRQWYRLERVLGVGCIFLSLRSILPPSADLAEAAWDEYLENEPARRDMFMRLMRSEAQLDNLVSRWPGVIFSQRPDYSMYFASAKIEEITGIPLDEWSVATNAFWNSVHESDAEHVRLHIKRCINSRDGLTANYRVRNRRTGRVAYLMEHRQAIKSETGLVLGYECVWLNITRQTIAEKRLTSAAWKETLAVITMGLAHDFSNIMAGIHALSESFLSQVKENDPFYEGLTMIKRHSFLATQLVQRIMTLYRGKTGERNYHDLNEIVIDLKELSHKVIPRRIEMEMALEKRQLPLYVDAVEMRQVILNLALNAAEAMPMGGKLSFSTSVHDKNPRPKNIQGRFPRTPALCLEVRDTGCGISDRFLDLVFDPFFTTKTTHKGSGLGLYNARLFVEKHHGAISVSSKPGDGTSICMWLPEADFTEQERGMDDGETHRYKLLVAGQAGRFADAQAELYRENGMHVVTADNIDKARDLISFEDPAFSAVLILVESSNSKWLNFISEINAGDFSGKIITHIAGCNQDEIDATALGRSDLVITQDDSEKNVIDNMRNLFET